MNKNIDTGRVERLSGMRTGGVFLVSGTVHMIRNEAELPYVREGEIVVAVRISAEWRDQLLLAKAVIEDASATDSVAEQLARQYDIPSVTGVTDAMQLRTGDVVTIDGDGNIERVFEKRAPDSPMRVSVPTAVEARNSHGIITAENIVPFRAVKASRDDDSEVNSTDSQQPASGE